MAGWHSVTPFDERMTQPILIPKGRSCRPLPKKLRIACSATKQLRT